MKTYRINIIDQTVTINGETCNFIEAGLTTNADPVTALYDRAEIEQVINEQNEDEVQVIFEGSEQAERLKAEIESYGQIEPRATMFVDAASIFWVTKDRNFIWMAGHTGINEYVNKMHTIETERTPEGVGSEGVWWNNGDFESPFHVSDFIAQIETINV